MNDGQGECPEQVRVKVFQVERLAAMPHIVWELIESLGDEGVSVGKIESLIESDSALTARVLSLANSAYYSLREKATTIRRAIVIIGFRELHILAIGIGLADVFNVNQNVAGINLEELWRHNVAVAWMAREFAESIGHADSSELLVAGLLHDLGKLVQATYLVEEYKTVMDLVAQGVPYYQAEEESGLKHDEIGYWLVKRWGLPDIHLACVRHHHAPQKDNPYYNAEGIIYLSDLIVKKIYGGASPPVRPGIVADILSANKMDKEHLAMVIDKAKKQLPAVLTQWRNIVG